MKINAGEKLSECMLCQKAFSGESNLEKHMVINTDEKKQLEYSHC